MFALPYSDDGKFRLRIFSESEEAEKDDLMINEKILINDYSMCNDMFPDPFITACFVSTSEIYVNLFHNYDCKHYHFIYNFETKEIRGKGNSPVVISDLTVSQINFPFRCLYNVKDDKIYSIYRQGEMITLSPKSLEKYEIS